MASLNLSDDEDHFEGFRTQQNDVENNVEHADFDCNEEVSYIEFTNAITYTDEIVNTVQLLNAGRD